MTEKVKKPRATKVAKVIGITPAAVAAPDPERAHAILGASGSVKWIVCHPSARLEESLPEDESHEAKEGTYAHAVFHHRMSIYLERETPFPFEDKIPGHKEFWSTDLSEAVDLAVERAIERIEHARSVCADPVILLEQRLDYTPWAPEGFGTTDMVIITDTYIEVLDLKMGVGLYVSALENSQFRLYMLGAYHTYGALYDVQNVTGTVLQPRMNNWSSETLELPLLLEWAKATVVPAATKAWAGVGEFVPGDHCIEGFCRAKDTCVARARSNLAKAHDDIAFTPAELLGDAEIDKVLAVAPAVIRWLEDVQGHALRRVAAGTPLAGWKLVAGRSKRAYTDEAKAGEALIAAGFDRDAIYEQKSLLGISAMEKLIGKKAFMQHLSELVTKPAGNPTLVPVYDWRQELNSTAAAVSDFSNT